MASERRPAGPPLQGLGRCVAGIPRALPWAGIEAAPLGLRTATLVEHEFATETEDLPESEREEAAE